MCETKTLRTIHTAYTDTQKGPWLHDSCEYEKSSLVQIYSVYLQEPFPLSTIVNRGKHYVKDSPQAEHLFLNGT